MAGLPREVLRWLQSLDLTWQIKTPKWDLSNGYIIAEIFSWYYPLEVEMHMYISGTSLETKQKNWDLLKKFLKQHKFTIPEDFIENTVHCKEGAAQLLIERIYEVLTNKRARRIPLEDEPDFTDRPYQLTLPMHARSTASQAVKNNLRTTELMADGNRILCQQKAQSIINDHIEHRYQERVDDPRRFNRKPTIGELASRQLPETAKQEIEDIPQPSSTSQTKISPSRETTVQFKDVKVKQMSRQSAGADHGSQSY